MPKIDISRKETIKASYAEIKTVLTNFNKWRPWSPWLVAEPEAKVKVSEDQKSYTWEGKRVGSGEMSFIGETEKNLEFDLVFLKPWKSKAKTSFRLIPNGDSTEVEWRMQCGWPFFLFFMKKQTEAYIGMDYERGLKMLKEYIETGKVESKLEFIGIQEFEGCDFVGITNKVAIANVGSSMEKDFTTLYEWAEHNAINISGEPFSQYHKWDVVKQEVSYTAAIPVNKKAENLPSGSESGHIPAQRLHTVRHHGTYDHLGNAWSTIMMQQRNKEFKAKKSLPPMEFYKNDPSETAPKDLVTDVCFALK